MNCCYAFVVRLIESRHFHCCWSHSGFNDGAAFVERKLRMKKRLYDGLNWGYAVECAMQEHPFLTSQDKLARRARIAQSTVGRIIRGETNPQVSNLERIARALRIPFATLVAKALERYVPPPYPADRRCRSQRPYLRQKCKRPTSVLSR